MLFRGEGNKVRVTTFTLVVAEFLAPAIINNK